MKCKPGMALYMAPGDVDSGLLVKVIRFIGDRNYEDPEGYVTYAGQGPAWLCYSTLEFHDRNGDPAGHYFLIPDEDLWPVLCLVEA